MFFAVRHVTRYRYDAPVRESVMQLIMQPKSEGAQRLQSFQLAARPRATLQAYTDHFGNAVYHFCVPGTHSDLVIEADATVEVSPQMAPPEWIGTDAWEKLEAPQVQADNFDMLRQTALTASGPDLEAFVAGRGLVKGSDPMTAMRRLSRAIYEGFDYVPSITDVDSPIQVALKAHKGVCQDFSHIMLAVARSWGIPARYVSGYLFTKRETGDRSDPDATHAWVEALMPGVGWVGFDPTNNTMAGERHIRVGIGRDYRDVPPTRGVYKGPANSELSLAVTVAPTAAPSKREDFLRVVRPMSSVVASGGLITALDQQQQ